ncbi:MAG TPA: hypothetical protein VGG29_03715 [Caulobacteraceae bacterium]
MFALLAAPAFADVVSPAPDAVAVTVYRDRPRTAEQLRGEDDDDTSGLAMITETRTVELPAGRSRIRFEGVDDAIIPASAAVEGLPSRPAERDFDYDLLTPGALIEKSVGAEVTVRRVDRKSGKVTEEPAVLRSGPDGVTVRTSHGVEALGCGDGPSALVFDHLPAGLADKPTLSVLADAPKAGRYTLRVSYLAVQVDWSADYVARIDPDGRTLDLTGWLTLSNRSGASFVAAPTAVVAGHLARVDPDLPDVEPTQRTQKCWPMGRTSDWTRLRDSGIREQSLQSVPIAITAFTGAQTNVSELVVTAEKRRVETMNLGDYKLYALAEPTTLAARQTKQIRFLHQPRVKFDKLYVYKAEDLDPDDDASPNPTSVVLSLENKAANGLGAPVPAGMVSVRQTQGGDEYFLGEHGVRDVPIGEPFELELGQTSQVTVSGKVVSDTRYGSGDHKRERAAVEFTIANAEPSPVTFELRQSPEQEGFKIVAESARHTLKNGADVWRLALPANASVKLSYTAEAAAE